MEFKFPSHHRVCRSVDFNNAFLQKGIKNKWFTVYAVDSKHSFARLGLVISKKTIPKSVSRNLAKRLARELFRNNSRCLPPLDFIVRIRRNLTNDACPEAKEALLQLIQRVKVL